MVKKPTSRAPAASFHPLADTAFALAGGESVASLPIHIVTDAADLATLAPAHRTWLDAHGFKPSQRRAVLLPGSGGDLAGVVFGAQTTGGATGSGPEGSGTAATRLADPMARPEVIAGLLQPLLPAGRYHFATPFADPELAAIAWGLGAYRFRRYKTGNGTSGAGPEAQLVLADDIDAARVRAIVAGTAFGRDLINTPASDMGPQEIEDATRTLATAHGATVASVIGDDLLAQNFPLIHAVGRASPRAPRLIDLTWQPPGAKGALPKVTLIGKGIAFDTGGLDLKPSAGMLIMKKDMGGAAAVLAAAHMIISAGLPVRLRVLIAAAENSVAGNAFRPLDIITSRAGPTVEIGNTDAEGRLVLADALALADEESPDLMVTFATLTGAARVALGPDLPPFFTDDEALAAAIAKAGLTVADPVWRLPFWSAYDAGLESPVADLNNVAEGPFAGSIIAALFLRRFVKNARSFAHFDIYGWRQAAKPMGPRGGEVNAARAIFALLAATYK